MNGPSAHRAAKNSHTAADQECRPGETGPGERDEQSQGDEQEGDQPAPPVCAAVVDHDPCVQQVDVALRLGRRTQAMPAGTHAGQPAAVQGVRIQRGGAGHPFRRVRHAPESEVRGRAALGRDGGQPVVPVAVLLDDVGEGRELPPRALQVACVVPLGTPRTSRAWRSLSSIATIAATVVALISHPLQRLLACELHL